MKVFTLFIVLSFSALTCLIAQPTIDFETTGLGAGYTWNVFENGANPALEFVANPNSSGINTSAKVAKFTAKQDGAGVAPYAGTETAHGAFGTFTLSASNSIVKIMVYKTILSDVGIKFAINNGGAQPEIKVSNTKINEWEELTFDFSGKIGLTESINIDQIIVFPDFASRAADHIIYFDNITFSAQVTPPTPTAPSVAATSPTRPAGNVISMFSNAYTNVPVNTWRTDWSAATLTDLQVAGNDTKKYSALDFVGIEATGANSINATSMLYFHVDAWTPNATTFKIKLVDFGADNAFGGGDDKEHELTYTPTLGGWNSFDIPLTDFTGLTTKGHISQIIFVGIPAGSSTVYIDNVYFHNVTGGAANDYNLVWSDEFSGTGAPADDHWFRQTQLPTAGGWYGGEEQHYTNRIENSYIANGYLNIVAKKESFTDQGQTKQYTSTRLNSKYAFKYGRVDVRAKMPAGAGTFPAIWMLGKNIDEPGGYFAGEFGTVVWPATGEIDIMEHWGNNPNVIHQSIHTPSSFGATVNTQTTTISEVSTTYHVYSIIWDENQIQFLIDDVAYYTYNPAVKDASTWPFNEPQYLLLNIAMGGGGGAIDPAFTQSTMEVDYVRVYQKGGTPAPPPAEPTVAATTPTRPAGNVISLFSNAYTNVPVTTWRTDWSAAKLTETQVIGNDVKKYNRLEYVSIETTGANLINASSMLYFHLDAWTPNLTTFRVKLVDFGADGAYDGGDDKVAELSFTPTLSGWNSYEIPLTDFSGLTTKSHIAQLILSGLPVGSGTVFIDNVYFHNVAGPPPGLTQMNLPVTFDVATVEYGLIGFGGAEQSTVVSDPTDAGNKVAKVIKTATAELWAGTTITAPAELGFSSKIPFTATAKTMNVRVYSPDAGIKVRLKVEVHGVPSQSVETEATTTLANAWETLTFNFANQASGTAAFNIAFNYDKASIFFNFGVTGATAGEKICYFDDIKFGDGGTPPPPPGLTQMNLPVTFDVATVEYGLIGFGGAEQSTVVSDPTDAGNKVAKVIKTATAELWAGTTITAPAELGFSSKIPFTATAKTMNVRVYSPDAGIKVRLKVEVHGVPSQSVETEATTTLANAWETLTFNFANQASGTAAFNIAFNYDKASIFFNFGVTGAAAGEKIYYFDDVKFGDGGTPPPPPTVLPVLPIDFESTTVNYDFLNFEGGVSSVVANSQSTGINTSAKVGKMVKNAGAVYAGSQIALASPIDFSTNKTFKVKVFMPKVGAKLLLKVENQTDATKNFEKEVIGTLANAWEELTFDYSAVNTANTYQKIILIFDLGTMGDGGANFTYLFDDIRLTPSVGPLPVLPVLPLDFESSTITYSFTDFEGGVASVLSNTQSNGINTSAKVGKMVKNAGAVYAGSLIALASPIDFTTNKTFKVKVFMPKVGAKLLLKVENQTDATKNFEKEVIGTLANAWEELTFDYSAVNTANTYQKIILIFDLGTMGDGGTNFTYLFDDIRLTTSTGPPTVLPVLPIDFESTTVNYDFLNFEGGVSSVVANSQSTGINTSAKVGKMVKNAGAVYAGSLMALASPIDFSTNKTFKVKVFMPKVGAKLLLKVENQTDATKNHEKEVIGTLANAWEELTFDYSAVNTANTYQKVILIFDLGTMGDGGTNFTYLFDDIRLTTSTGPAPTPPVLPIDFESTTVNYDFLNFEGGVSSVVANTQSNGINTSAKVGKMVKNAGAVYAGSLIALASPIDFSSNKAFKVKVFMPKVGAKLLLKVENQTDATKNFEKEVTGTVANAWEELTFDYSAINTANTYQKIILIFDLGTMGDGGTNFTYLFDDIRLTSITNVVPVDQQITFPAISDKTLGGAAFNLTATASSNLAVNFSSTSDKITISGTSVSLVKAGRASVIANQAGNQSFNPAKPVEQSFCIKPAKPTIVTSGANTEAVTLTSSASSGNQWFLNGTAIANATNATLSATAAGLYKVQVKVDDCTSDFSVELPFIITGDINSGSKAIIVYPNPVENYLEVRGVHGAITNAQISDLAGRRSTIIFEKDNTIHRADVQHLSHGIYILQIQDGSVIHKIKVIKK